MRPIDDPSDVPVLHWIKMNVVDMAFEIGVISNRVLPVTPLPDALLSFSDFARRSRPYQRVEKSASPSGNAQSA